MGEAIESARQDQDLANSSSVGQAADQAWMTRGERGSIWAIRFTVFVATVLGRRFGRVGAYFVAFYYMLFARSVRRSIVLYYRHLEGRDPSFAETHRQVLRFVQTTYDAFFLISGKTQNFRVTTNGDEHLAKLRDEKRGAILLGAHLGSFYAMRVQSGEERLPIYPLVFHKQARMINRALEELDPKHHATLIQMDPSRGVDYILQVKEVIEQGGICAILGDRAGHNGERTIEADFLGAKVRFPIGPYLLAYSLKCPVYLTFGLYRGDDRYDLYCEPFAEKVDLPRKNREEALENYVRKYAARLEHYTRSAKDNWFNFYDYWEEDSPRADASEES